MKNVKLFEEFVNEKYERYEMSLTKMINLLKEVNKLYPDAKFSVPMGYHGNYSSEEDLKDAIAILKEQDKDHKAKKDDLQFFIWHVDVSNRPSGFDKFDIIKKGVKGFKDFSKKYSRQFDNSPYITNVRISIHSPSIDRFGQAMSSGAYGSLD
jgi:transcription elongation factor GreA-like protein